MAGWLIPSADVIRNKILAVDKSLQFTTNVIRFRWWYLAPFQGRHLVKLLCRLEAVFETMHGVLKWHRRVRLRISLPRSRVRSPQRALVRMPLALIWAHAFGLDFFYWNGFMLEQTQLKNFSDCKLYFLYFFSGLAKRNYAHVTYIWCAT